MRDLANEFNLYVRKAIRNTVLKFAHNEQSKLKYKLNEEAFLSLVDEDASFSDIEQINTANFETISLGQAIKHISKKDLELLELTIVKGYSDREVALLLSEKENTITQRKIRAIGKLKKYMEEN